MPKLSIDRSGHEHWKSPGEAQDFHSEEKERTALARIDVAEPSLSEAVLPRGRVVSLQLAEAILTEAIEIDHENSVGKQRVEALRHLEGLRHAGHNVIRLEKEPAAEVSLELVLKAGEASRISVEAIHKALETGIAAEKYNSIPARTERARRSLCNATEEQIETEVALEGLCAAWKGSIPSLLEKMKREPDSFPRAGFLLLGENDAGPAPRAKCSFAFRKSDQVFAEFPQNPIVKLLDRVVGRTNVDLLLPRSPALRELIFFTAQHGGVIVFSNLVDDRLNGCLTVQAHLRSSPPFT